MILNAPKIKVPSGVPAWVCASGDRSLAARLKPALTLASPAVPVWSCAEPSRVLVSQPGAAGEKSCLLLGHGLAGQSGLCWLFSCSSQGFPQVSIHWRSCFLIRLLMSPGQMDTFKWRNISVFLESFLYPLILVMFLFIPGLLSCVLLPQWVCVTCSDSWLARCRLHMPALVVE